MMSLVLGLGTIVLGVYSLTHWFAHSSFLLKLLFPVSFICGGCVAFLAGLSSFRKPN